MDKPITHDVIIIGAGPAGSTAGYLLSKSGFKVLIIDKSTFPRHKLCAGCITYKTVKLLERVFGESVNTLKAKNIINYESKRYEIFFKNKSILNKESDIIFYFVERYVYDAFLLEKARQAGAEVIEGEAVVSLDAFKSEIKTSGGRIFAASFLIGADGVNSRVRRSFPLHQFECRKWQYDTATALEIFVDRSHIKRNINYPCLYFDYIDYGYGWVFPNREKVIVGLGGLTRKNKKHFVPFFQRFLSSLDFNGSEQFRLKGYAFPYGSFMLQPVYRNIILVGDAAGFSDPLLGEGIYYAQKSAELATGAVSKALKEAEAPGVCTQQAKSAYLYSLQKNIYPEFIYAKKIRNVFFKYIVRYHYYPLKIFMNLLSNKLVETVHGIRSYKWMRKLIMLFLSSFVLLLHL